MIELVSVSARAGQFALHDVTFTVPQGGYAVVIGPTGAGKTTLLEAIAGLVPTTSGIVRVNGADVTHLPPESRDAGLVYQHAHLFPHLTVGENVAYGAKNPADAADMLRRFGLEGIAARNVRVLSGGERQIVAIARALAARPGVLLLDEPFAALDPRSRNDVRRILRSIYYERRCTTIHVTHDFDEAGLLGDLAVLIDGGRVVQAGKPAELFRRPASPYIARFLGAENVFAGYAMPIRAESPDWERSAEVEGAADARPVAFNTGALTVYALGDVVPGYMHAVIHAEDVMLSLEPLTTSVRNQFSGRVVEIAPAGALSRVTVDVGGTRLVSAVTTRAVQELGLAVEREVVAAFKATAVHLC